jgi:mannose-6-phosphate isomerase
MSTTFRSHSIERTERPWGWYESIDEASFGSTGFKVKRIGVHPGSQISHWVVVRGTAVVTLGEPDGSLREVSLQVGEHVDIALGQIHRLANRTEAPVEIVEVQLGSYLGEDDITRLADDFGRV